LDENLSLETFNSFTKDYDSFEALAELRHLARSDLPLGESETPASQGAHFPRTSAQRLDSSEVVQVSDEECTWSRRRDWGKKDTCCDKQEFDGSCNGWNYKVKRAEHWTQGSREKRRKYSWKKWH
jgi:hypothetical protein